MQSVPDFFSPRSVLVSPRSLQILHNAFPPPSNKKFLHVPPLPQRPPFPPEIDDAFSFLIFFASVPPDGGILFYSSRTQFLCFFTSPPFPSTSLLREIEAFRPKSLQEAFPLLIFSLLILIDGSNIRDPILSNFSFLLHWRYPEKPSRS